MLRQIAARPTFWPRRSCALAFDFAVDMKARPMFLLSLMLMLGALFDNRMEILGIGAGLLVLSGKLLVWFPFLRYTLPSYLLSNSPIQNPPGGIMMLAFGQSIEPYTPTLVVEAVECVLFVLVALWRFNQEEF